MENHHVSAPFILMQEPEMSIFGSFSTENYKKVRERIISMVLATDMTCHFSELAKLKGRLAVSEFDLKDKDKYACMDQIIHAADISNPIKPFSVYFQWTERVLDEFFDQVSIIKKTKNLNSSEIYQFYQKKDVTKTSIVFLFWRLLEV